MIESGCPDTLACDVLIIGSGAGGASVAEALATAGRDVIVLEEGGYYPADKVPQSATDSFSQMWRSSGLTPALGRQSVAYAEGQCVGGGTEINSAIFQTTPPEILQMWEDGLDDFTATDLDEHYGWAEDILKPASPPTTCGRPSTLLRQAGETMGWRVSELKRGAGKCVGTNLCSFGCPTGAKQSMTRSLLPVAADAGARIYANMRVRKLVRKNGRATHAICDYQISGAPPRRVLVQAEHFFICAGTVHSAHLLKRSGLAPHGGSIFQLHPTVRVMAEFDEDIDAINARLPLYAITEFMPDLRMGGSVLTAGTFGMALAEDWQTRKRLLDRSRNIASYYAMIRPEGTGRIYSVPGFADPIVTYELSVGDRKRLGDGVMKLAQALSVAGAKSIIPSIAGHHGWDTPDDIMRSDTKALDNAKFNLMSIHLFSSMSTLLGNRICDSFGRVFACDNVTVADGSLLPSAPGVNPQVTIMAFARRAVSLYLRKGGVS